MTTGTDVATMLATVLVKSFSGNIAMVSAFTLPFPLVVFPRNKSCQNFLFHLFVLTKDTV